MSTRSVFAATIVWVTCAVACSVGPDSSFSDLQPLVFPSQGELGPAEFQPGSTVAIVLDSNYIWPADNAEYHNLDGSHVSVVLRKDATTADASLRAVFSVQAPPNSIAHLERTGATVTLALLDLPPSEGDGGFDPGVAFPYTAILEVWIDGVLAFEPRIRITGDNGSPNELLDAQFKSPEGEYGMLATQPTLRLRPKRAPGTFAPGQPPIGAIEFTLMTSADCLAALRAYPAGDAANATTMVSPPFDAPDSSSVDLYRVVLFDPEGINLTYLEDELPLDTTDETLAGQGPILDLSFVLAEPPPGEPVCDIAEEMISIEDLRVYDVEANELFEILSPNVDTAADPLPTANFRLTRLLEPR